MTAFAHVSLQVGFGDFHPTSDIGKLAVSAYALFSMQVTANAMELAKEVLIRLCTVSDSGHAKDN